MAVESLGPIADDAHRFITEIDRRMTFSTGIREKRRSCTNASQWRFNATTPCVLQTLSFPIRSHSGHYHLHRHNNNNNNNNNLRLLAKANLSSRSLYAIARPSVWRRLHLPEIGVQSDAPLQKRRFRKLSFNSASAITASADTFCDRNLAQRI